MTAYIFLSVPHMGEPTATFMTEGEVVSRFTDDLFICDGDTALDMLREQYGCGSFAEAADEGEDVSWLADLAARFGENTPLYAAYRDGRTPEFDTAPLDMLGLALDECGYDLSWGECIPVAEVQDRLAFLRGPNAPRIGKCGPVAATHALEREFRAYA